MCSISVTSWSCAAPMAWWMAWASVSLQSLKPSSWVTVSPAPACSPFLSTPPPSGIFLRQRISPVSNGSWVWSIFINTNILYLTTVHNLSFNELLYKKNNTFNIFSAPLYSQTYTPRLYCTFKLFCTVPILRTHPSYILSQHVHTYTPTIKLFCLQAVVKYYS